MTIRKNSDILYVQTNKPDNKEAQTMKYNKTNIMNKANNLLESINEQLKPKVLHIYISESDTNNLVVENKDGFDIGNAIISKASSMRENNVPFIAF